MKWIPSDSSDYPITEGVCKYTGQFLSGDSREELKASALGKRSFKSQDSGIVWLEIFTTDKKSWPSNDIPTALLTWNWTLHHEWWQNAHRFQRVFCSCDHRVNYQSWKNEAIAAAAGLNLLTNFFTLIVPTVLKTLMEWTEKGNRIWKPQPAFKLTRETKVAICWFTWAEYVRASY